MEIKEPTLTKNIKILKFESISEKEIMFDDNIISLAASTDLRML